MHNDNNRLDPKTREISLSVYPGVVTTVSTDAALDYLEMKTAQLSAINHLLTSGDFEGWNDTVKSDAKMLAAALAEEVVKLVQGIKI